MLLHPAPPQRLDVFGSEPAVSGQRGLTLAQRQQPTDRFAESHISVLISCQSETIYEMYERVKKKKKFAALRREAIISLFMVLSVLIIAYCLTL